MRYGISIQEILLRKSHSALIVAPISLTSRCHFRVVTHSGEFCLQVVILVVRLTFIIMTVAATGDNTHSCVSAQRY